jgi:hypothetical protein
VDVEQLDRGLWRWTAPHPEWEPGEPGSADDWPRDVGCVLFASADRACFVDPLLPGEQAAFWSWSDELCAGRAVSVLSTVAFHSRSRDAVAERYGAASCGPLDAPGEEDPRLAGARCLPLEGFDEMLVWLPAAAALIVGDALIGDADGGVRLCPASWLDYTAGRVTLSDLRDRLRPLLALAVERVLVSHGEPVRSGGRAALERALAGV